MGDRILVAVAIVVMGVAAYRLLLFSQAKRAKRGAHLVPATGRPVLLVFTSPTCAPCKLQQMPIAQRLMDEWNESTEMRVVDVTEQPEVAARFGVWSLPTTVVLDAAQNVVAINQGVASESKLRSQLAPLVYRSKGPFGNAKEKS